ncbi:major facilitator superfamily domain-containing protein [Zopfochytrium polystomum]|nr:major facilitator superfamily domain-containing protein [Zopfochytrium polystomum]
MPPTPSTLPSATPDSPTSHTLEAEPPVPAPSLGSDPDGTEVAIPLEKTMAGVGGGGTTDAAGAAGSHDHSAIKVEDQEDANDLVTWDGPDDYANPRNWPRWKKWVITLMVGCFTLLAPMGSSIIAPAIPEINVEFNVTNTVEGEMSISLFVLAFALGPLFIAPLSELYGRRWVILLPGVFFLVFNIACGFSQNMPELLAFRFLSSLGGSAPLAIGAGIISDIFPPDQIGLAMNVYSLAPSLGPVLGPIVASFLVQYSNWRWIFHFLSIFDAAVLVLGFLFLQETYAPAILSKKAAKLGKPGRYVGAPTSLSLSHKLTESVKRPFILLFTQPIVQTVSLYMAYVYGLIIGVSPIADRIYFSLKAKHGGVAVPEFRLPLAIPIAVVLPAALFAYGWSAQAQVHWLAPDAAIAVFAFCFAVPFQIIQIYLVDSYRRYAASAMAAATFLRSCAGFAFPLFAGSMYDRLDYGWGNSVLAFVAVAGIPAPLLVYRFGAYLRAKSTYAAG